MSATWVLPLDPPWPHPDSDTGFGTVLVGLYPLQTSPHGFQKQSQILINLTTKHFSSDHFRMTFDPQKAMLDMVFTFSFLYIFTLPVWTSICVHKQGFLEVFFSPMQWFPEQKQLLMHCCRMTFDLVLAHRNYICCRWWNGEVLTICSWNYSTGLEMVKCLSFNM